MSSDPAEAAASAAAATPLLVVTAHPGDLVWRAAGAIAPTTSAGGHGGLRGAAPPVGVLHRPRTAPRRPGQAQSGPNLGLASETWAEAYQRAYPHVTTTLA
jgi:hypothetical protein